MIRGSYQLTRILGIPIRVHITLIILLPFLALQFATRGSLASFFFGLLCAAGVFVSVAAHELGHSWIAIRKGCRVREIMLWPIGGIAKIDRLSFRPIDEFLIAVAGPAISVALALLCRIVGSLFSALGMAPFALFFLILSAVNLALFLFNLLPAFPMDGGRILRAFMTPRLGRLKATALAVRVGRVIAVVGGIFGLLHGEFMLVLLAFFIDQSAGAEYRAVYAQQMAQGWGASGLSEHIEVSPPPYRHNAPVLWMQWKQKAGTFFSNLFNHRL